MNAVYKKELKSYFTGMTGAIFVGFILLIAGIYTVVYNLKGLYPNFEYVLSGVSFIYLLTVPVLTMRSFAEEKHSKTDQLLYSLPISVTSVVMAKYLAMLTVLLIPCAVMAFYPLILCMFGTVHLTGAYAALLAFFLLGASLISIGMFVSSLTESQVISAVISLLALILINFMSGLSGMYPTLIRRVSRGSCRSLDSRRNHSSGAYKEFRCVRLHLSRADSGVGSRLSCELIPS